MSTETTEKLNAWTREIVEWHFNPETGLNVFFNRDNNKFISGWLLRDDQLDNMVNRGAL